MSAFEVTDRFEREIPNGYALRDRQLRQPRHGGAHGRDPGGGSAVETVDACLGRVVAAVEAPRGRLSRDGRPRQRRADARARRKPAHCAHHEPGAARRHRRGGRLADGGTLADLVPTCLTCSASEPPAAMTGQGPAHSPCKGGYTRDSPVGPGSLTTCLCLNQISTFSARRSGATSTPSGSFSTPTRRPSSTTCCGW